MKRKRRKKQSNKVAGLALFAAGAVMLGMALWLAGNRFPAGTAALSNALSRTHNSGQPIDIGPERPPKQDFTDNALIQAAQGLWVLDLKDGRATLAVQKDFFQILFVPFSGAEKGWRLYSLGDLEVKDHFLVLAPRNDPAPPQGLPPALKPFSRPLTLRAFAVEARIGARGTEEMIWKKGPETYGGVHGVGMFHPLFAHSTAPEQDLVWTRAPAATSSVAKFPATESATPSATATAPKSSSLPSSSLQAQPGSSPHAGTP